MINTCPVHVFCFATSIRLTKPPGGVHTPSKLLQRRPHILAKCPCCLMPFAMLQYLEALRRNLQSGNHCKEPKESAEQTGFHWPGEGPGKADPPRGRRWGRRAGTAGAWAARRRSRRCRPARRGCRCTAPRRGPACRTAARSPASTRSTPRPPAPSLRAQQQAEVSVPAESPDMPSATLLPECASSLRIAEHSQELLTKIACAG